MRSCDALRLLRDLSLPPRFSGVRRFSGSYLFNEGICQFSSRSKYVVAVARFPWSRLIAAHFQDARRNRLLG